MTVDEGRMTAALDRLAAASGTAPIDGAVRFAKGKVRTTPATDGEAIDPDAARAALASAYLSDSPAVDLELDPTDADIDQDDVQAALNEFANPAVSGPVTLVFDKSRVKLQPADFSSVLSMKAEGGSLVPESRPRQRAGEDRRQSDAIGGGRRAVRAAARALRRRPDGRADQRDRDREPAGAVQPRTGTRAAGVRRGAACVVPELAEAKISGRRSL